MSPFGLYECDQKLERTRGNKPIDSTVHPGISSTGKVSA